MGPSAAWRSTILSHEAYVEQTPLQNQSPWMQVAGWRRERTLWDDAHVLFLGVLRDVGGSVVSEFLKVMCAQGVASE
eukprot:13547329-Alexandrium_andersonii.AAC.1